MNKKLLATVLASTMVLGSMSVYAAPTAPALSGDATEVSGDALVTTGQPINVTTKVESVTIKVALPTGVPILFNPYRIDGADQVLSTPFDITNNSDTAVKATLTKWTVKQNNPTAATAPTMALAPIDQTKSTKKEAFLWLQGAPTALPSDPFSAAKDKAKVVPAKDAAVSVDYGSVAKGGVFKFQFKGDLNDHVVWTSADTMIASPTFKFEPTYTAPVTP